MMRPTRTTTPARGPLGWGVMLGCLIALTACRASTPKADAIRPDSAPVLDLADLGTDLRVDAARDGGDDADLGGPDLLVEGIAPPDVRSQGCGVMPDPAFGRHRVIKQGSQPIRALYVGWLGLAIVVADKELSLVTDTPVVQAAMNTINASAFDGKTLILSATSPDKIYLYDDQVTLKTSLNGHCYDFSVAAPARFVCTSGHSLIVYDEQGQQLKNSFMGANGPELRWIKPVGQSGYLVGATTTPGVQLHALRLLADNTIQYICPSPHSFDVRVGPDYLVDDAAKQVIATEGQVLDVFGTQCATPLSSDYLIKVGEVSFLDRQAPPGQPDAKEFFITAANDGHTIAGLVDRGSDPDAFDCADGCSLIKVEQATRKLIAKIPLKLPISLGPVLSAYDGLCDALIVSYRDKAKPDVWTVARIYF